MGEYNSYISTKERASTQLKIMPEILSMVATYAIFVFFFFWLHQ